MASVSSERPLILVGGEWGGDGDPWNGNGPSGAVLLSGAKKAVEMAEADGEAGRYDGDDGGEGVSGK